MSMPGFKNLGAQVIISEIGIDMSRFPTSLRISFKRELNWNFFLESQC
jgi:hypothetical protein